MATQIIPGALRETSNPLLLKAGLGKSQRRGFALPPEEFTYGKTTQNESYGAGDSMNWQCAKLKPLNHEKKPVRDFVALNREATRAGLVTSQEHFQYRATHEKVAPLKNKQSMKSKSPNGIPVDMVHGVPTKPSTPVFDLLEHKYQGKWLEEVEQLDTSKSMKEKEKKGLKCSYGDTRAARLHRYSPPVEPPPLWQMPKFQKNALPALQTFRSEEQREKAFRHHSTDCTARTGVFGHGTYESAKS